MADIQGGSIGNYNTTVTAASSSGGSMLGSLISGVFNMGNQLIAGAQAKNADKRNQKWQLSMYNRQLADNRANWQMQNEYNEQLYNKYNSPAAMVQQYQDAGLNPALMYNGSGNAIQSSGSVQGATPSNLDITSNRRQTLNNYKDIIPAVQGMLAALDQHRLVKEQIKDHSKNRELLDSQINAIDQENWRKNTDMYVRLGVNPELTYTGLGLQGDFSTNIPHGLEAKQVSQAISEAEYRLKLTPFMVLLEDNNLPATRQLIGRWFANDISEERFRAELTNRLIEDGAVRRVNEALNVTNKVVNTIIPFKKLSLSKTPFMRERYDDSGVLKYIDINRYDFKK